MQGTRVQALVREDPTCRGATKPMRHNYWACTLEPASHNYWGSMLQLLKPTRLEPVLWKEKKSLFVIGYQQQQAKYIYWWKKSIVDERGWTRAISHIQELDPEEYSEVTSGESQMYLNERTSIHLPKRGQEESSSINQTGSNNQKERLKTSPRRTDVTVLRKQKHLQNLNVCLTYPWRLLQTLT